MRRRKFEVDFPRIDHYEKVEMTVRGTAVKDILRDPEAGSIYIAKLGGRNSDLEVMTEYIIYLVGQSLGVRVAEGRLATFDGRLRFLSRYFLDPDAPEELVHGMELFKELYDEAVVESVLREEAREQEMFTVQAVKAAFGAHYMQYGQAIEENLFGDFVAMLTHDALIGVQDRHHENWGLIVRRDIGIPPRFAPLYDSARGLFGNYTDAELAKRYKESASLSEGARPLDYYIARSRPLIGFAGLQPSPRRRLITHDQLLAEVFRAYPEHRGRVTQILESYDWTLVRDLLATRLPGRCSAHRRQLILNCLRRRLRRLWRSIEAQMHSSDIN